MADEKKDEKKGRGKLYDYKKPEAKKKDEPKAEAKPEGGEGEEKPAAAAAADGAPKEEKAADPFDLMKTMHERHRTERRDHHGNSKSQMDQMFKRHTKELEEAYNKQMEGLKSGPGVTAEEVAPEPPAEIASA